MEITMRITMAKYKLEGSSGVRPQARKHNAPPTQSMRAKPLVNSINNLTQRDVFFFSVNLFSPYSWRCLAAVYSVKPFSKFVSYFFLNSSRGILWSTFSNNSYLDLSSLLAYYDYYYGGLVEPCYCLRVSPSVCIYVSIAITTEF